MGFLTQSATAQVTFYVAPNGSDANNGMLQKPFKTLTKALLSAQRAKGLKAIIQLRKGSYYLDKTLVINAAHALFESLEITSYKNEPVFIDGGQPLQLAWKPSQKGIYQAVVAPNIAFEQLFIDGQQQPLARYPNYDANARVFTGPLPTQSHPNASKLGKIRLVGTFTPCTRVNGAGFTILLREKTKKEN